MEEIVQHYEGNTEQCCHDLPNFNEDPFVFDEIVDSEEDEGHMLNNSLTLSFPKTKMMRKFYKRTIREVT